MSIIKDTVYSVDKSKLDTTPMRDLGTATMSKLKDLSPLIVDFVQQDKAICLLDSGTGFGKSYSINSFLGLVLQNQELFDRVNKIFYLTDRNKNVDQEYEDFISRFKKEAGLVLAVKSNKESVQSNSSKLEELSPKITALKEYASLEKAVENYDKNNNISKEQLADAERSFRKAIKKLLLEKEYDFASKTYEEKIDFLEYHKDFKGIIDLYPSIMTKAKKIIFMTIDKFFFEYDTIIEKRSPYLYQNEDLIKNSLIILDESDAMAERILEHIVEKAAQHPVDIISKIKILYNSFSTSHIPISFYGDEKKNIENMINDALKKYKEIEKKYYINYSITFKGKDEDNARWLFARQEHDILYRGKNEKNQYIDLDVENSQAFLMDESFLKTERKTIDPNKEYSFFVKEATTLLSDFYKIIKKMANIYKSKNEDYTIENCIKKFLDLFGMLANYSNKDTEAIDELVKNVLHTPLKNSNKTKDEKHSDFYLNPGELVKTELPENRDLMIKLVSYQMSLTPEKFLKSLVDHDAKIILSSATSRNKSMLRNFNLNWKPLKEQLFKPSLHSKKLESEYYSTQEKNKNDIMVNVDVIKSRKTIDDILKYINKDKEKVRELLEGYERQTDKYSAAIIFDFIWDALYKLSNNVSATLVFLKKDPSEYKILEPLINNVIKKEYPNSEFIFTLTADINEKEEEFKNKVAEGKQCFLVSTYSTVEKGVNLKIKRKVASSDVVLLNDFGQKEFKKNLDSTFGLSNVYIDIDGVFLGDISYIYPSIDFTKPLAEQILKASYYAQSINKNDCEISDDELNATMSNILSCSNKYPFQYIKGNKKKYAYVFKIVSSIIQAVGRKCRCNIRAKSNFITISSRLYERIQYGKSFIAKEDLLEKQPFEIKAVFNKLLERNKESYVYDPQMLRDKYEAVSKALDENTAGKPEKLKRINNTKYYTLSKEEYEIHKGEISATNYIKIKPALLGHDGYTCNKVRADDKGYFGILASNMGEKTISLDSLDLTVEKIKILEDLGMSFDPTGYFEEDSYILSPYGFDKFVGKIGELLGRKLLQEQLPSIGTKDLKELPDPIYEKMDDFLETENYILVIDYKYRLEMSDADDNREDFLKKYENKILEIDKYFHKKNGKRKNIIAIEMDLRNNGSLPGVKRISKYKFNAIELKNSIFLCLPNVYNEDGSVCKTLFSEVLEIIKHI